jgi:hypothetical protein
MRISQALMKLAELQREHGDLDIVDSDGDMMEFSYIPANTDEHDFPIAVILGDWKEYDSD